MGLQGLVQCSLLEPETKLALLGLLYSYLVASSYAGQESSASRRFLSGKWITSSSGCPCSNTKHIMKIFYFACVSHIADNCSNLVIISFAVTSIHRACCASIIVSPNVLVAFDASVIFANFNSCLQHKKR